MCFKLTKHFADFARELTYRKMYGRRYVSDKFEQVTRYYCPPVDVSADSSERLDDEENMKARERGDFTEISHLYVKLAI
jgi:hypothetical protein